jgi:hypothetical protein
VLNAPCGEGGDSDRPSVSATYLELVCHRDYHAAADHGSLDSMNMYADAGTELNECVLDRIEPPNRQAWPVPPPAAPLALLRAFNPSEICCAGELDPLHRHAHSTQGNIVQGAT